MKDENNSDKLKTESSFGLDISRLRLSQDFSDIGVKKVINTIPIRRPNKQEFVRVHPNEEYRLATAVLELKEEGETYVVDSEIIGEIHLEITPKILLTTINRQGVLSLWPITLPGEDGRSNEWNRSALSAASRAESRWVRVRANMSLGAYEIYEAPSGISEPEWPELSFQEILNIAFKDRLINSLQHPVLRRLRGEI
ncbi:MAG: hypothetical protein JSS07_06930 [Proteobacteria bacterium]|nr:hypothetical protein [Pseudomonadota bacterium]